MRHHIVHAARAMSLVEVVIAMAIFATVIVMALTSLSASQGYAAMGRAQDDLVIEAERVADAVAQDLAVSGWKFIDAGVDALASPPKPLTYAGATRNQDRTQQRYYPYVQIQQAPNGTHEARGKWLPYTHRAANLVDLGLPPEVQRFLVASRCGALGDGDRDFNEADAAERAAYRDSFLARSQEISFVKASVATWDHLNDRMFLKPDHLPTLYFSGTRDDWRRQETDPDAELAKRRRLRVLYSSGWTPEYSGNDIIGYKARPVYSYAKSPAGDEVGNANNIPYGVVMESGWFPDLDADMSSILVNWQSMDGTAFSGDSQAEGNLAEFGYAVVPTRFGLGRLVRTRRVDSGPAVAARYPEVGEAIAEDTTYATVVDRVLSDNVVRVVFDTYRTVDYEGTAKPVTTLGVNSIRMRLYLARRVEAHGQGVLTRVVERVVAMRSQNADRDKDQDADNSAAAILGDRSVGIDY